MSKSTSMLPTLAGGSGVPTHTLGDADLMKVVDSVTLNAYRDRKVTLAELKAFMSGSLETRVTDIEADIPSLDALKSFVSLVRNYVASIPTGVRTTVASVNIPSSGTWMVSGQAEGLSSASGVSVSGVFNAVSTDRGFVSTSVRQSANYPFGVSSFCVVTTTGSGLVTFDVQCEGGTANTVYGTIIARRIA